MNAEVRDAILQKLMFKPQEMRTYQAAVIYTAMAMHPGEVAADDVPAELRPGSSTTAGCVFALLKSDGCRLFERVGRRASKSPGRHYAWINTYRLTSRALANVWLGANGFEPLTEERFQMELIAGATF